MIAVLTSFSILLVLIVAVYLLFKPLRESGSGSLSIRDIWRWQGTVDGRKYFVVGAVGFAIKHNIDRIIATAVFGRRFTPLNYWIAPVDAIRIDLLPPSDVRFIATMALISLPFIWVGLAMTIRRLRSAGLPLWLVIFFFLPIGNLAFFLLLSLIPSRTQVGIVDAGHPSTVPSLIPRDKFGSAAMAVALTAVVGALATYVGVQNLGTYGWGIFVALPFCFGLLSVLIYSYHERRSLNSCLAVSMLSVGIVALALFAFAIEGLICIAMALPIAMPLAVFGGAVGFLAQRHHAIGTQAPSVMLLILAVPFGVMTSETIKPSEPYRTSVRTTIRIDAPAARVWKNLIAFPDVVQPPSALFRAGVAYPINAVVHGEGVGAIRECLFSTGTFVEKIDVWDEGKRFGFTVMSGPEGMQELSPYNIHPRHLSGYFVPESAEFRLISNSDGSTQLEGISWYRNAMWPAAYWRLWSDGVIHQVHMRVFEHVKTLSEQGG